MNPYAKLPEKNFWKHSVAGVEKHKLNPIGEVKFQIRPSDRVITAGSCFAQHIARELQRHNFNYHVTEQGANLPPEERSKRNYGTFSARYGNIYTMRQFRQLLGEAFENQQTAKKAWRHKRGFFVDPYRPRIEPDGFVSEDAVIKSRQLMLAAVRQMVKEADVMVFTLGLTEAWRSTKDGAVFPLAPGVFGGKYDKKLHEFINFGIAEVIDDSIAALEMIRKINPRIKVILTVSPVPLAATYEDRHVLVSTTYSKSVLRVAAEEMHNKYKWVQYFPSYEIITGNYTAGTYYEDDFREVNRAGVKHVMRCFLDNMVTGLRKRKFTKNQPVEDHLYELECDEEEIRRITG